MNPQDNRKPLPSRRGLLAAASGLAAGALVKLPFNDRADAAGPSAGVASPPADKTGSKIEPFFGDHQSGIITRAEPHVLCRLRPDVLETGANPGDAPCLDVRSRPDEQWANCRIA